MFIPLCQLLSDSGEAISLCHYHSVRLFLGRFPGSGTGISSHNSVSNYNEKEVEERGGRRSEAPRKRFVVDRRN